MNMENNKKMGIATIVNTAGAVLAYLIGAGFASGQEVMQFFSNWGSVGGLLEIGIIFVVVLTLTYIGVGYIGGEYWEYKPVDDCYVWQATKRRHWWGPTKAEVSLVWLIGRDNVNRKGGAQ